MKASTLLELIRSDTWEMLTDEEALWTIGEWLKAHPPTPAEALEALVVSLGYEFRNVSELHADHRYVFVEYVERDETDAIVCDPNTSSPVTRGARHSWRVKS
jgi:hypothetical protein